MTKVKFVGVDVRAIAEHFEPLFSKTFRYNAVLHKKIKMGNKRGLKTILGKQHVEGVEEAFKKIESENKTAISSMKRSISAIIVLSLVVILAVSAGLILVLVRKLVRKPLDDKMNLQMDSMAASMQDVAARVDAIASASRNRQIWSRSRRAKNFTTGMWLIFRG